MSRTLLFLLVGVCIGTITPNRPTIHEIAIDHSETPGTASGALNIQFIPVNLQVSTTDAQWHYIHEKLIRRTQDYFRNTFVSASTPDKSFFALDLEECAGLSIPTFKTFYGSGGEVYKSDDHDYTDGNVSGDDRLTGNWDYYIYLDASTRDLDLQTWGAPCAVDQLGRPMAGRVWVNLSEVDTLDHEDMWRNILRSMINALGFHASTYEYWVDNSGTSNTAWNSAVTTDEVNMPYIKDTARGKAVYEINTTKALAAARTHFNCDTLNGIELEYSGDYCVPGSLWDKRIMFNDVMTAGIDSEPAILSSITMAAMEDTGWYTINSKYTYTERLTWGKDKGCTFFEAPCVGCERANFDEFCDDFTVTSQCTHEALNKGTCHLKRYAHLIPYQFKYFNNPFLGGEDIAMDYCPYVIPFEITNGCRNVTMNNVEPCSPYGEHYGANSRCVEGTYIEEGFGNAPHLHAGCHDIDCSGADEIIITVGGQQVSCPKESSAVLEIRNIPGFVGTIQCPDPDVVCRDETELPCIDNCSGHGSCVTDTGISKCSCDYGYGGANCEFQCDKRCSACYGPDEDECTAWVGDHELDDRADQCFCCYHYHPDLGWCDENDCLYWTIQYGMQCVTPVWEDGPALRWDFTSWSGRNNGDNDAYYGWDNEGYLTWTDGTYWDEPRMYPDCYGNAYWQSGAGAHMTGNGIWQSEVQIHPRATVLMWLKPYTVGTLLDTEIQDDQENTYDIQDRMTLFITECWGLQLYSGSDRAQTSLNAVSDSNWTQIALTIDFNLENGYQWWQAGYFKYDVYVNGEKYLTLWATNTNMSWFLSSFDQYPDPSFMLYVGGWYNNYYRLSAIWYQMEVYYAVMDPEDFEDCTFPQFACSIGQYDDGNGACTNCSTCSYTCSDNSTCTDTTCTSCDCSSATACSVENCTTCGDDGNKCLDCDDDYNLTNLYGTCSNDSNFIHNNAIEDFEEACDCSASHYFDNNSGLCMPCAYGCHSCVDHTYLTCYVCHADFNRQVESDWTPQQGHCADWCPTNFVASNGQCTYVAYNVHLDLNEPKVDFTDGDVTLRGGISTGFLYHDDPRPYVMRGQFFDGNLAHYKVMGITLNHSFLMYFMVRNMQAHTELGALYASRRFSMDRLFPDASEFVFGIKQDNLVFSDLTHDLTWESGGHFAPFREWAMVQLSMEFFYIDNHTTVKMDSNNGSDTKTFNVENYALFDNPSYHHTVGGIQYHTHVYNPFTGFIFEIAFMQANAGAGTLAFYTENQGEASHSCLCGSACTYYNECPWSCDPMTYWDYDAFACMPCAVGCIQGCRHGANCNVCASNCDSQGCTGYHSTECVNTSLP